jgi:hypothetical protein
MRCAKSCARIPARSRRVAHAGEGAREGGDATRARRALDVAFQLAPNDRDVLASFAEFHLRHGDVAQALVLLDRLVDAYPETGPAHSRSSPRSCPRAASPHVGSRSCAQAGGLGSFIVSSCGRERIRDSRCALRARLPLDLRRRIRRVIDRLRDTDRRQQAYQVWLNVAARASGDVASCSMDLESRHRPGLRLAPDQPPRDSGHLVECPAQGEAAPRASDYNGKRQSGVPIAQYVVLARWRRASASSRSCSPAPGAGRATRGTRRR